MNIVNKYINSNESIRTGDRVMITEVMYNSLTLKVGDISTAIECSIKEFCSVASNLRIPMKERIIISESKCGCYYKYKKV